MLQEIVEWILKLFLDDGSKLFEALSFFFYDTIKILLLLLIMISIMGFIRSYVSATAIKKLLKKDRFGLEYFSASAFGALTPFCSCSSIPLFFSFIEMRIPLGVAFSFLITSPLVNEYLVVLMYSFFGLKVTIAYVIFGIMLGVIGGFILNRLNLEKLLEKDFYDKYESKKQKVYSGIMERVKFGLSEAGSIIKKVWLWVVFGVGLGAIIHNFVPSNIVESVTNFSGFFSVPIAVILGVPMYGSCAAIVPIATVLFEKGLTLGTALAFMMATSALSLPQAVILRRVMSLKLIGIFFGVVTIGIVIIGYVFNVLSGVLI